MSTEKRTPEEKIEEFKSIIYKLRRREERLKERLFKGGTNLAFDTPVAISGIRKLIRIFELAQWVVQSPDGKAYKAIFQAKKDLQAFALSIKDLFDTATEMGSLDQGTQRVLSTYIKAMNDAYEELIIYAEKHPEGQE